MLPNPGPVWPPAASRIIPLPIARTTQLTRFQSRPPFTRANESIASVKGVKKAGPQEAPRPQGPTPSTLF
jgi:hypothetical protein